MRALPTEDLELAFQWAEARRVEAVSPWQRVLGPAGATVTTLARLGWKAQTATAWLSDDGMSIDLNVHCPKTLKAVVEEAAWLRG